MQPFFHYYCESYALVLPRTRTGCSVEPFIFLSETHHLSGTLHIVEFDRISVPGRVETRKIYSDLRARLIFRLIRLKRRKRSPRGDSSRGRGSRVFRDISLSARRKVYAPLRFAINFLRVAASNLSLRTPGAGVTGAQNWRLKGSEEKWSAIRPPGEKRVSYFPFSLVAIRAARRGACSFITYSVPIARLEIMRYIRTTRGRGAGKERH